MWLSFASQPELHCATSPPPRDACSPAFRRSGGDPPTPLTCAASRTRAHRGAGRRCSQGTSSGSAAPTPGRSRNARKAGALEVPGLPEALACDSARTRWYHPVPRDPRKVQRAPPEAETRFRSGFRESGRPDLNRRPLGPQPGDTTAICVRTRPMRPIRPRFGTYRTDRTIHPVPKRYYAGVTATSCSSQEG